MLTDPKNYRSSLYIPGEHTVDFIAFSKLTNGWTTLRPGHEYSDGQSDILHSTQDDILSTSLKKNNRKHIMLVILPFR